MFIDLVLFYVKLTNGILKKKSRKIDAVHRKYHQSILKYSLQVVTVVESCTHSDQGSNPSGVGNFLSVLCVLQGSLIPCDEKWVGSCFKVSTVIRAY